MKRNLFFVVLLLFFFSCARVGSPDGGAKDITPPKVVKTIPDSMSVNVSTGLKELRIDFDEYITLKNPTRQLIISPPIKNITKIIPSNTANKYVLIQWKDTLKTNTTYNFNFGNGIADNNEGNILPYYSLVFSTGNKVDSLYISGYVDNVLQPRTAKSTKTDKDKPIVVGLYKADVKNYKDKPYYLSPADDDGYFELNYLAKGNYKLIAFQDDNLNNVYDSGKEQIAFLPDTLHLDKPISGLRLLLSPPKKPFKYVETKEIPGGLTLIFEGKPKADSLDIKALTPSLKDYKITHKNSADSAYVWINPSGNDLGEKSTNFKFSFYNSSKKKIDTISSYYKVNPKEELELSNSTGNIIPPGSMLRLKANMQLRDIDSSQWEMHEDSLTTIPFQSEISQTNSFELLVKANFQAGKSYSLKVPKETVSSYFYSNPKTNIFNFEVGKADQYGSVKIVLVNAPVAPFWIQLLDSKFDVKYEQKIIGKNEIEFTNIQPEAYSIRILVDNNKNGQWDGADFENNTQPEDAYLYKSKVSIRPLWLNQETWDLKETASKEAEQQIDSFIPTGTDIKNIDTTPKKIEKKKPTDPFNNDPNNPFRNQNNYTR